MTGSPLFRTIASPETKTEPRIISPSGLDPAKLDKDAVRSLKKLQERRYEAYLVGGCVRDLLVGAQPKDFDIATDARPQHIKRVFPRNCRIIGRRFKLAHLHFNRNQKILEAATFRRTPVGSEGDEERDDGDDLLITRDNEFGTAQEDALRRDFTVNALFFDPHADRIIDYVDGLSDIRRRIIRTIGEPEVRFREDPVRILRAAKFAGRLGFHIDEPTYAAMQTAAPDLTRAAPPRLLEEILRLLRGGHALASFQILRDVEAIQVMLPLVGDYLATADRDERVIFWRLLDALDNRVRRGEILSNGLLLAVLFNRPVMKLAGQQPRRSSTTIAEEIIAPFALRLRLPRKDAGCLKRICSVQPRFGPSGEKRRFKLESFLHDPYFPDALALFEMTCLASRTGFDGMVEWRDMYAEVAAELTPLVAPEAPAAQNGRSAPTGRDDRDGRDRDSRKGRDRRDKKGSKRGKERDKRKDGRPEKGRPEKGRSEKKRSEKARPDKSRPDKGRPDKKHKRKEKVQTIEPEAIDVSAFDVELDPKRVPTFSTIVDGPSARKKKRKLPQDSAMDDYKPPPPPGSVVDDATPPPAPPSGGDDDVFGDW